MARLTDEEWADARKRWENDPRDGFDWLSKELNGAVSRQAISKRATKEGWAKGGKSDTSEKVAQPEKKVAQPRRKVAQPDEMAPPKQAENFAQRIMAETVGPGRPTLYDPEFCDRAFHLCLLGATNEDLAAALHVCTSTIDNWLRDHLEFLGAVQRGRMEADAKVAHSLYRRAVGCTLTERKVFAFQGTTIHTDIPVEVLGDVGACRTWLFNRRPDLWKATPVEKGGDDGDIPFEELDKIAQKSLEQAEKRHRELVEGRADRLGLKLDYTSEDEDLGGDSPVPSKETSQQREEDENE